MNNYNKTLKHFILKRELEKTEGVIKIHKQHWVHKTRDQDKQNKRHKTKN